MLKFYALVFVDTFPWILWAGCCWVGAWCERLSANLYVENTDDYIMFQAQAISHKSIKDWK